MTELCLHVIFTDPYENCLKVSVSSAKTNLLFDGTES